MKTLNPLGESPILDCSNAVRKNGNTACRFFCTNITVLIKSLFFFFTVSNVKGVTINMNTMFT
jgi:hypothetical protein